MNILSSDQMPASANSNTVGPKCRKPLTITLTPVTTVATGRSISVVSSNG